MFAPNILPPKFPAGDLLTRSAYVLAFISEFGRQGAEARSPVRQPGGYDVDTELLSEKVQVERKLFSFDLRENPRGRFLRVTEDVGGRRDTIIIPSTGLKDIREIIDHAIDADEKAGPCESKLD